MKKDALTECFEIGQRDRNHFDWPDVKAAMDKVFEEFNELKSSLAESRISQVHELGDLLFTVVQVARHLKIDPALALEFANRRYTDRFENMQKLIALEKLNFENMELHQLEKFWSKSKKQLKAQEIETLQKLF